MKVKRITRMALLTAIALTIFMVEAQIPPLVPIPGIKLGLANIITVWAMFALGPVDTLMILSARIILGSVFSGQLMTMLYSFSGGLLCYLSMLLLRKLLTDRQVWAGSIIGAMAHNIGQLLMASAVMGTSAVWYYCPVLMISGILTGAFTGLAAQFLYQRLSRVRKF